MAPSSEIPVTLDSLTWKRGAAKGDPTSAELYLDAKVRMVSRPLLELQDGSLFAPLTSAVHTGMVLIQKLAEGTWIESLEPTDTPLIKALRRRRQTLRPVKEFEGELASRLAAADVPHLVSIGTSPKRPSAQVGVAVNREIDALVAQPTTGVVWVIEAKDFIMPFSARSIRNELQKYYGTRRHEWKLEAKCADIAIDPDKVAQRLGAPEVMGGYRVCGLFVTREPTPAASYDGALYPFVTMDRLLEVVGVVRAMNGVEPCH